MKKTIALILALGMVFSLCACGQSTPSSAAPATEAPAADTPAAEAPSGSEDPLADLAPITITFAVTTAEEDVGTIACKNFIAAVEERSGGKITFDYYPNGQLGSLEELTEAMATGALDMGKLNPTMMTEYVPEWGLLILPFLVKDYDHFGRMMESDVVKEWESRMENYNISTLGYTYSAFRSICSKTPITTVADCNGILIRSAETKIYLDTLSRMGFKPTPVPYNEMYTALQSGIVDAAEPSANVIRDMELYKICPYVCRSNHMFSFDSINISTALLNSLPEAYKTIIIEEAAKACEQEHLDAQALENSYFDDMAADGATITTWDNFQELIDLFMPYWQETIDAIGGTAQDFVDTAVTLAQN